MVTMNEPIFANSVHMTVPRTLKSQSLLSLVILSKAKSCGVSGTQLCGNCWCLTGDQRRFLTLPIAWGARRELLNIRPKAKGLANLLQHCKAPEKSHISSHLYMDEKYKPAASYQYSGDNKRSVG